MAVPTTDDIITIHIHNETGEVTFRTMGNKEMTYYIGIMQSTMTHMIVGGIQ